ncbi:MAG: T9SS type A sorting domain-containing protein [Bacteroidetes bacterium]|nr:T9SS type A sorting domain-containing protein [Bacteroidota bacterium]
MKTKLLLVVGLLFAATAVSAQEYLQMIDEGTHTVSEISANAEAYFADKDKGRGSGYKQFKRWQYMANRQQDVNGYLTPVTEKISQLEAQNAYLNETAGSRPLLDANWEELGPFSWNQTSAWSPGVGRVTGIAIDPADQNHIIVGANTGGVWRTTDGGGTWTPLGDYFTNLRVYSVAMDPNNSDIFYFGSSSGLVYKSSDVGATWSQLADLSDSIVNKILVNPDDSNTIFATSSSGGVYRTTDGGFIWDPVITGTGYDVEFKPGDTSIVYASGNGFHRSIDGGATFTQITGFDSGAKMIGVSPANEQVVYVLDADGGGFGSIYRSDDEGLTFTELPHANRNYFGYDVNGVESGGQAPRDMAIAVNPSDVDEVHIAGILTWRSTDGGINFENTSDWIPQQAAGAGKGYCHADVDIMEYVGTNLYVGTDGGIFKAETPAVTSATMYEDITDGLGIRQFYKIGVSQTDPVVITGGSQDNGTGRYSEAEGWTDWLGADGMETFVDKYQTNRIFGTSQNGQLYRSYNGGQGIFYIPEPPPGEGNWVTPFEQDPEIDETIYVGYDMVWKSENNGNQWSAISQDLSLSLNEMKIAPSNNQIIYASRGAFTYKTEDGGATDWQQMATVGSIINSIAIHPLDPNKVAIATSAAERVYVTEDGGVTWNSMSLNLPPFNALAVVWDNNGEDGLYVGMDYGLYYIDNTFSEWQPYFNNLPNVIVNELEINFAEGKIYAGTYGRGLWVSPTQDGTIVLGNENTLLTEEKVSLFPNPAANELTIQLTEAMETDIRIFDVSGKLVIYQADVAINGRHTLNISSLTKGVYFVRLNSDFGTVTQKIIKQ